MYNKEMIINDENAIKQALANVRLEGFEPSKDIKKHLIIGADTKDIIEKLRNGLIK